MDNVENKSNKLFLLVDEAGDDNQELTQEFLDSINSGLTIGSIISEREESTFVTSDSDVVEFSNGTIASTSRIYIDEKGVKYIEFTCGDYRSQYQPCDLQKTNFNQNMIDTYNKELSMFRMINDNCTSEFNYNVDYDSKGTLNSFHIDLILPISFFDFIKNKEDYHQFLKECDFSNGDAIDNLIEEISKQPLLPMKGIFNKYGLTSSRDHWQYGTTEHPELKSSVFELNERVYCIHCYEVAKSVQVDLGMNERDRYRNNGHRCTCNKALMEMVEKTAFAIVNPKHVYPKSFNTIARDKYFEIIEKIENRRLPLGGNNTFLQEPSNLTPKVIEARITDADNFHSRSFNTLFKSVKSDYSYPNSDCDANRFITAVKEKVDEIISLECEALESILEKVKSKKIELPNKLP